MNMIVAADKNWAIGKDNSLLVVIPADQKTFRNMTLGHPVVMGRKTFESLPGRPAPGSSEKHRSDDEPGVSSERGDCGTQPEGAF